jgi:hypothetical protein
MRVGRLVVP